MRTASTIASRRIRILLRSVLAGFVAATPLGLVTTPATAQMLCGDRDQIVVSLSDRWDEQRTGIGLSSSGAVWEIFSSQNGTWTMLVTTPDGPTCIVSAGEHWDAMVVETLGESV